MVLGVEFNQHVKIGDPGNPPDGKIERRAVRFENETVHVGIPFDDTGDFTASVNNRKDCGVVEGIGVVVSPISDYGRYNPKVVFRIRGTLIFSHRPLG